MKIKAFGFAQVRAIGLACVIVGGVGVCEAQKVRQSSFCTSMKEIEALQGSPAFNPNSGVSVKMNGVDPLRIASILTTAVHEVMLRQAAPGEC